MMMMRKLISVALAVAALAGTAAAQDLRIDRLLDGDAFVVVTVDAGDGFAKNLQATALYKAATDPSVKAFLEGIEAPNAEFKEGMGKLLDFPAKVEKQTGKKLLDALASMGEIALVMPRFDRNKPGVVLTVDLKGDAKLQAFLMEQLESAAGAKAKPRKVDAIEVVDLEGVLVGNLKNLTFFASDEDVVRMLAAALSKPPAESLAASKRYQHARASVQAGKGALFVYCNIQPLLPELDKEATDPTAKTLLEIAGLGRIGYVAASVAFENLQVVVRAHLNANLEAAPYTIDPAIFDRKPADLRKDPSIKMIALSQSDEANGIRAAVQTVAPFFAMAAQQGGMALDPAAIPVEQVARNGGVARNAAVLTDSGLSYVGRSNLGMSFFGSDTGSAASAGMFSALMMPAMGRATMRAKTVSCMNNLRQLWQMEQLYMMDHGKMPEVTGSEFWLALCRTDPPLIDPAMGGIFGCPLSRRPAVPGTCGFTGPARDVGLLADEDPVGMCDDPAHGPNAIILMKSGEVREVSRNDALYEKALETTKR